MMLVRLVMVGGLLALGVACGSSTKNEPTVEHKKKKRTIELERSTAFQPTFPCTQCHEHKAGNVNPKPRKLAKYHAAKNSFDHGKGRRWCFDCHAKDDLNKLVLSDGSKVGFGQSHELCGTCHGEKFRDWNAGVHGLNTGYWNGKMLRRSCTLCHDPHLPAFATMIPEDPPATVRGTEPPSTNHNQAAKKSHE